MSDVALRNIKTDFYHFLDWHGGRLNLVNFQFQYETGDDLKRSFTWFGHDDKIEEARLYAEEGTYIEYFGFCVRENYYSLQIGDGSLVQIHLRANSDGMLEGGSLAFAPRPGNGFDYLRFDYEPSHARHYRHNRYHVHFGFHAKNMRVSSFQFPWPSEFVAFVGHLMSDKKGRAVVGSDFHADVEITGFNYDHLLQNLSACGEHYNHSFAFQCKPNGGTRSRNLKSSSWREDI